MIEVAQEEAFDCQLLANEEKLVDRQRLSACCRVGHEHTAVRQHLNERCRRITDPLYQPPTEPNLCR